MIKPTVFIEKLQRKFANYTLLVTFATSMNNSTLSENYLLIIGLAGVVFVNEFFHQDLSYYNTVLRDMRHGTKLMNGEDNLELFKGIIERTMFFRFFGFNNFVNVLISTAFGVTFTNSVVWLLLHILFVANLYVLSVKFLYCRQTCDSWVATKNEASRKIKPTVVPLEARIIYMFILTDFTWGGYDHLSKIAPYLKLREN